MRAALLLLVLMAAGPAAAQGLVFGSADDPAEAPPDALSRSRAHLSVYGGPSYLGADWFGGLGFEAEGALGPLAVRLEGRYRADTDGLYEDDADELYDALRLVRYARLNPTPQRPVYARLGPIRRLTLGPGHLVRDFATTADWDERTVGVEAALSSRLLQLGGFTSDVRMDRLVGGRLALRPFGLSRRPGLGSLVLGATAVHDLGLDGEAQTTAFSADARFDVLGLGDFRLTPFVSYAEFLEYGSGLAVGASFGSNDLASLGRLRAGLGLTQSNDGFIPGYFNAFYPVENPAARIVDSDAFFRSRDTTATVGTPLAEASGGTALFFELEAVVFGTVELSQYVRRDFGGSTGDYSLRLTVSPDRGRDFRFLFELHRQGLDDFGDLFSDLTDEALLIFHLDYAVRPPVRLFLRSRYGYTGLTDGLPLDGAERYLVERRFEPMVGITIRS